MRKTQPAAVPLPFAELPVPLLFPSRATGIEYRWPLSIDDSLWRQSVPAAFGQEHTQPARHLFQFETFSQGTTQVARLCAAVHPLRQTASLFPLSLLAEKPFGLPQYVRYPCRQLTRTQSSAWQTMTLL